MWSWESSKALEEDGVYLDFLRLNPEHLPPLCSPNLGKLMRGSRSTTGASETRSTQDSTTRTSGAFSRPPPYRESPSNIIDIDEDNGDGDNDGHGPKPQ